MKLLRIIHLRLLIKWNVWKLQGLTSNHHRRLFYITLINERERKILDIKNYRED